VGDRGEELEFHAVNFATEMAWICRILGLPLWEFITRVLLVSNFLVWMNRVVTTRMVWFGPSVTDPSLVALRQENGPGWTKWPP